jgi:hypothetical protein
LCLYSGQDNQDKHISKKQEAMRITTATFSAAAMLFAISSSLPQLAPQGEKPELDHGDTTHPRRLFSRGSKERRYQQVTCSGNTLYGDALSSDIATATAHASNWCSSWPDWNQPSYYPVNDIQVYICNYGGIGCADPQGQVADAIAKIQAQCGANIGGWFSAEAGDTWTFGFDPAAQNEG